MAETQFPKEIKPVESPAAQFDSPRFRFWSK